MSGLGGTGSDGSDETLFRLWREGARAFADLAGQPAGSGADGGKDGAWQRAQGIFEAWSRFLEAMAAARAEQAASPGASPFDPAGWLRGEGEGGMADLWRWLEGPDMPDLLGEQRRIMRESREWIAWTVALEQFRQVVARGWTRAFHGFAALLAEAEEKAEARPGAAWDRLTALWREAADAEWQRLQASEPYLAAQRDLLDAGLALRASLRARAETVAEFLGLPTRAELDDLTETVHALRRELRLLRRELAGREDMEPGR